MNMKWPQFRTVFIMVCYMCIMSVQALDEKGDWGFWRRDIVTGTVSCIRSSNGTSYKYNGSDFPDPYVQHTFALQGNEGRMDIMVYDTGRPNCTGNYDPWVYNLTVNVRGTSEITDSKGRGGSYYTNQCPRSVDIMAAPTLLVSPGTLHISYKILVNYYVKGQPDRSLAVNGSKQAFVQCNSGTGQFEVASFPGWTAKSKNSWITLVNESGTGNEPLKYTVAKNYTSEMRTGTIVLSGDYVDDQVVTITQAPAGTSPDTAELQSVELVPRWPWNGFVDIYYTVKGKDGSNLNASVAFSGYDNDRQQSIEMKTLYGDGIGTNITSPGTYMATWNAAADQPDINSSAFSIKATLNNESKDEIMTYLVVDLSGGVNASSYPYRYTNEPPDLTKNDCRTTELWLRKIPAGTFTMGSPADEYGRDSDETQHQVKLTRDYFIGIFECTQKQWQLVMGTNPSYFTQTGESEWGRRPVERVSYDMLRGTGETAGAGWPEYEHAVDANSFMGKIQQKTGLVFDLPTEAQWEYACRLKADGTCWTTSLNSGESPTASDDYNMWGKVGSVDYGRRTRVTNVDGLTNLEEYGQGTLPGYGGTDIVGMYSPSELGLYDMHGNVAEWCLDKYERYDDTHVAIDPVGDVYGNTDRVVRGGSWYSVMTNFRAAYRVNVSSSYAGGTLQNTKGTKTYTLYIGRGFRVACNPRKQDTYLVVDLSGGPDAVSYPVRYTNQVPNVSLDTCRTTELWLRKIPAGTFTMGSPTDELGRDSGETQHQVTLTKDYYIGVFECTQRQWELVMGTKPSYFSNADYYATRPVEQVSYNMIRGTGAQAGAGWPAYGHTVDASSFMGKIQEKTGLTFDLPTEAQWEYACRKKADGSCCTTALNSGKNLTDINSCANMAEVGRYDYNGGSDSSSTCTTTAGTAKVGSYQPSELGLYDMHGNVWEWCLDRYASYNGDATDPAGATSGSYRVFRSGSWNFSAQESRAAVRGRNDPSLNRNINGFRLAYEPNGQRRYSVSFTLTPSTGKWTLRDGTYYDSGETVNLPEGVYRVSFSALDGYVTPSTRYLEVKAGVSQSVTYTKFDDKLYMRVDLSDGATASRYPITYLSHEPLINDDLISPRAECLWLRKISAGTFTMGSPADKYKGGTTTDTQHQVTLTKDFYIGIFECTQEQWQLVMGKYTGYYIENSGRRPVNCVSYSMIRGSGSQAGAGWPTYGHTVDADSFMGKLQQKTGLVFDLPTEAQWEYACRKRADGTCWSTALNSGKDLTDLLVCPNVAEVARYNIDYASADESSDLCPAIVGKSTYLPSELGLYDMHGNVAEWCLDLYGEYTGNQIDPVGATTGFNRVIRGGHWCSSAWACCSAARDYFANNCSPQIGFRIVCLSVDED